MKRISIIFVCLLIVLSMVALPIGIKVSAEDDYGYLLMAYPNPAFWAWLSSQGAGMGMQAENLNEQLGYLNRNGNIDEWMENVYNRYLSDVEEIENYGTFTFKSIAQLWYDLFTGNLDENPTLGFLGIKDFFAGSLDEESVFYMNMDSSFTYNDLKVYKIDAYINMDIPGHMSGLSTLQVQDIIDNYGIPEITYQAEGYNFNYRYYHVNRNGFPGWMNFLRINLANNSVVEFKQWTEQSSQLGLVPYVSYGDAQGSYYNLYLYEYYEIGGVMNYTYNDQRLRLKTNINANELEQLVPYQPVAFDDDVIGQEITQEDIAETDWVQYELDRAMIEDYQELLDKIDAGTDTAEDWTMPQERVIDKETTNTIIREIIYADTAIAVPDIDFPDVKDYEMPTSLIYKFPFCIPFDVYRAFNMMVATPEIPDYDIPINFTGYDEQIINVDLTQFQGIVNIIRWFLLAGFILGLIMATRKLIKG